MSYQLYNRAGAGAGVNKDGVLSYIIILMAAPDNAHTHTLPQSLFTSE